MTADERKDVVNTLNNLGTFDDEMEYLARLTGDEARNAALSWLIERDYLPEDLLDMAQYLNSTRGLFPQFDESGEPGWPYLDDTQGHADKVDEAAFRAREIAEAFAVNRGAEGYSIDGDLLLYQREIDLIAEWDARDDDQDAAA